MPVRSSKRATPVARRRRPTPMATQSRSFKLLRGKYPGRSTSEAVAALGHEGADFVGVQGGLRVTGARGLWPCRGIQRIHTEGGQRHVVRYDGDDLALLAQRCDFRFEVRTHRG